MAKKSPLRGISFSKRSEPKDLVEFLFSENKTLGWVEKVRERKNRNEEINLFLFRFINVF